MVYKYLPDRFETKLKSYKYHGIDHSVLYKYLFSPIADCCLRFTPEWLAPNTITLIGFLFVLIPHLVLWAMFPVWKLEAEVPTPMIALLGITHLLYMNFDNLDGKQARKTGNSSPLGLLFDHGCDSIILFIQAISLMTCLNFGYSFCIYLLIFLGSFTFFTTTLEEYYTNIMYLPIINGAAEGCVAISLLYIVTAILGSGMWDELSFGITNRVIVLGGFFVAGLGNLIGIIKRIHATQPDKLISACHNMLFFLYIALVCFYVIIASPVGLHLIRLVLYIFCFNFCKLVSILQISHIADSPFIQFRKSNFLILSALLLNTFLSSNFPQLAFDQTAFIWITLGLSFACYIHMAYCTVIQFSNILSIRVFKVKQSNPSSAKGNYQNAGD